MNMYMLSHQRALALKMNGRFSFMQKYTVAKTTFCDNMYKQ